MMKEWIEARRKELKDQQVQALSIYNQSFGALAMLDATETELNKPRVEEIDDGNMVPV